MTDNEIEDAIIKIEKNPFVLKKDGIIDKIMSTDLPLDYIDQEQNKDPTAVYSLKQFKDEFSK